MLETINTIYYSLWERKLVCKFQSFKLTKKVSHEMKLTKFSMASFIETINHYYTMLIIIVLNHG